jgi:hypothetical protein
MLVRAVIIGSKIFNIHSILLAQLNKNIRMYTECNTPVAFDEPEILVKINPKGKTPP